MSSQYVVDLLQLLQWKQLFDTAGEKSADKSAGVKP